MNHSQGTVVIEMFSSCSWLVLVLSTNSRSSYMQTFVPYTFACIFYFNSSLVPFSFFHKLCALSSVRVLLVQGSTPSFICVPCVFFELYTCKPYQIQCSCYASYFVMYCHHFTSYLLPKVHIFRRPYCTHSIHLMS